MMLVHAHGNGVTTAHDAVREAPGTPSVRESPWKSQLLQSFSLSSEHKQCDKSAVPVPVLCVGACACAVTVSDNPVRGKFYGEFQSTLSKPK